jgi:hypothetical protein
MKRLCILVVLLSATSATAEATNAASPAPDSAVGRKAEAFIRSEKLSTEKEARFRKLVLEAQSSVDDIERTGNQLSDEQRAAIWQVARKRASAFLSRRQLKDLDQSGWPILFIGPNGTSSGRALGKLLEEASPKDKKP